MDTTETLVDRADLDELLREVDRLCERRDWDGLVRLRDLCRAALERGRQVWPIASHAEHRLALEAPPRWAAAVLVPEAGQLGLGPLSEVVASVHTWAALAPHAPPTPVAALAAHERVLRGEEVDPASVAVPVLDLPLRLAAWEPEYPVAAYTAHGLEAPRPALPALAPAVGLAAPPAGPMATSARPPVPPAVPDDNATPAHADTAAAWTAGPMAPSARPPVPPIVPDDDATPAHADTVGPWTAGPVAPPAVPDDDAARALADTVAPWTAGPVARTAGPVAPPIVPDDDAARALADTVAAWTAGSNGRAAAVAVEGDAAGAVAALGAPPGLVRLGRLTAGEAMALLCWAGASGGAHGRRRGAARGRFDAWWAASALCGLDDRWPPDPDELGEAAAGLRWHWWDAGEPDLGWTLRLAVEDPVDGLAWAISASDAA